MTHVAEPTVGADDRPGGTERVNHWINGARVAGSSGRSGPVYNPATGYLTLRSPLPPATSAALAPLVVPVLRWAMAGPLGASRLVLR